jgi:hypothetical protein
MLPKGGVNTIPLRFLYGGGGGIGVAAGPSAFFRVCLHESAREKESDREGEGGREGGREGERERERESTRGHACVCVCVCVCVCACVRARVLASCVRRTFTCACALCATLSLDSHRQAHQKYLQRRRVGDLEQARAVPATPPRASPTTQSPPAIPHLVCS